jgi:hypothetical protein
MFFISIKWWSIKITIFFYFLFLLHSATGQVVQSDRFEIPLGIDEVNYSTTSANQHGIFLHRNIEGTENNAIQIIFLDTTFNAKWAGFIAVEKNYYERKTVFYDSALFMLLRYKDYTHNDLKITIVNKDNGAYTTHSFRNFIPLQITHFYVTREAAIIGGYFNRVPVVIHYSFSQRRSKIVPGLFNDVGELVQVRTYPDNSFDVLVGSRNFQNQHTMTIRNYNGEGDLIKSVILRPEEKKNLIFGQSIKTFNEIQLVAGVYGNKNSEFSKGIFVAGVDAIGNERIRYYSYGDLQNFFKYMRARREQRVKERIARRKIKGRKIRFNYRLIVHEIVPYKDQYIMLGEAFYPKYIYSDGHMYRGFFSPMQGGVNRFENGRIFDGYYYTHAVILGFNNDGKLLWDNSFEINDVRTFQLEQFVKLDVKSDHITLLYLYDHKIRSKTIKDNEVVEGKTIEPIKLKYETDETGRGNTESSTLNYWFEHHFYATGVQTVTSQKDRVKRRVFFINKVTHP